MGVKYRENIALPIMHLAQFSITMSAVIALSSYLIGSLTFAYFVGLTKRIDLRREGSGNLGAYNTGLVMGKRLGILVLILDAAKGALAVGLAHCLTDSEAIFAIAAVFVVL